jgi:hypothetical protein
VIGGAWFTGDWGAVGVALVRVSGVLVAGLVWLGVLVLVGSRRGWWL